MSPARIAIFLIFLFSLQTLIGQLVDSFDDGNFTSNPSWVGTTNLFTVDGNLELQSEGVGTDTIYLSTVNSLLDNAEWRIYTRAGFSPSNSNFSKIYLTADRPELDSALKGYFIRLGESLSKDGIDLYRQDSLDEVLLIDGPDSTINSGWDMLIKVNRDAAGNWEISADFGNTGTFQVQGQILDNTYTTTTHFGLWIAHTSSRSDAFFFDDCYIGPPIVDTIPPMVDSLIVLSQNEIRLVFSEVIDQNAVEDLNNFEVIPTVGTPMSVIRLSPDSNQAVLTFPNLFQRGINYQLVVSNMRDRVGNQSGSDTLDFEFNLPEEANFADLIITEIMADPNPVVGLPLAEYLEIHNRSTKLIDLAGWTISNGSTVGELPAHLIQPGDYVILVNSAQADDFTGFGTVISPSRWTSLVNTRDNVGLRSKANVLIDSVDYQLSWYQDADKDNGGWSLERINPNASNCPESTNWRASEDNAGGTPGTRNSVFSLATDETPPRRISIEVIAADSLLVCFDESMDESLISDSDHYELEEVGSPQSVFPIAPDFRCAKLFFDDPLPTGEAFDFSVQNVADCSGNLITAPLGAQLLIGRPAEAFEVVLNELMPDPSPVVGLPDAEFVEIHNTTDEVLAIDGWGINSGSSTSFWGNVTLDAKAFAIICSRSDSALFAPFGRVIAVSSLPSLTNSFDEVLLVNANEQIMDYVYYDVSWYQDIEKALGGYTLERINPFFTNCNSSLNWRASADTNGGTPGQVNSRLDPASFDIKPPVLTDILIPDPTTVVLVFDKQMNPDSMADASRYSISPNIGQPDLALPIDPLYRTVELLLPAALDSQVVYRLGINQAQDCAGNQANLQGRFGVPEQAENGDLLISEILFNTFTGGRDFVEIYNASNKVIRLTDLRIGRIFPGTDSIFNDVSISLVDRFMLPQQHLCLTADELIQREMYLPPDSANFLDVIGFPSFPDREGECVIFRADGLILDRFAYLDDYHFPTLVDVNGVSLERIALDRPTGDETNWHSASSIVGFATPGYPNSQAQVLSPDDGAVTLERQTVSPDDDGFEDNLPIHYDFDFNGGNARVSILDAQGHLIRTLKQNTLLGTGEGTFFWDGRDDDNTRADAGIYVVLFEVSRQDTGERLVYKRACVVAKRLD